MPDASEPGFDPELDTPEQLATDETKKEFREAIVALVGDGTELNEDGENWKNYSLDDELYGGTALVGSDVSFGGKGTDYFVTLSTDTVGPSGGPAKLDTSYTLEPDGNFVCTQEVNDPQEDRRFHEEQEAHRRAAEARTPEEKLEAQVSDRKIIEALKGLFDYMDLEASLGLVKDKKAKQLVSLIKSLQDREPD